MEGIIIIFHNKEVQFLDERRKKKRYPWIINPYKVMSTAQARVRQAIKNKEQKKVKEPISETNEIELEKVP